MTCQESNYTEEIGPALEVFLLRVLSESGLLNDTDQRTVQELLTQSSIGDVATSQSCTYNEPESSTDQPEYDWEQIRSFPSEPSLLREFLYPSGLPIKWKRINGSWQAMWLSRDISSTHHQAVASTWFDPTEKRLYVVLRSIPDTLRAEMSTASTSAKAK